MPHLIVVYGAPFSGKSTIARAVATALAEKTAIVSADYLAREAIAVHGEAFDEMEMVTTQVRLLVANYLKSRYNVVLEGAFSYERPSAGSGQGELLHREQEIDQLATLMRNMAPTPVVVRLMPGEAVLRERALAAGRESEIEAALRISNEYRVRYGNWLQIDTGVTSVSEAAESVLKRVSEAEFP